jgi:hypothetical protein
MVGAVLLLMAQRVIQMAPMVDVALNMGMFNIFSQGHAYTAVLTDFYRYCGSTLGHCLVSNGCQNGCTQGQSPTTTNGEPVIVTATGTTPPNAEVTTTDGTCGVSNGNTVCGNWPNGNFCSMYGFW